MTPRMLLPRAALRLSILLVTASFTAVYPRLGAAQSRPRDAAPAALSPGSTGADGRRVLPRKWVPVWRQGGGADDTLFSHVREHVVVRDRVYVLDAGALQLHVFNANTGAHIRTVGGKGKGPGQFMRPVDLAEGPNHSMYVLDPGNGRIAHFDASGRVLPSISSPFAVAGQALCVMRDGGLLVHTFSRQTWLVELDTKGGVRRGWTFPFPVATQSDPFIEDIGSLRGAPADECRFYTTFGFGMVTVHRDRTISTAPYVERVALPRLVNKRQKDGGITTYVESGDNAGTGGSVWRDTTVLMFAGANRKIVVDLYDGKGQYLGTWPAPPEDRLFYANGRLYGLSSESETPKLRVWVHEGDTTRVLRDMGLRPIREQRKVSPPARPAGTPARRSPPAPAPR